MIVKSMPQNEDIIHFQIPFQGHEQYHAGRRLHMSALAQWAGELR